MEAQPLLSPVLDWLIVLLSVGLPGGAGGPHDPQLMRIIPRDAVVALEWGGPNRAGKPVGPFDAFRADPEIARATAALQQIRDQLHPTSSPIDDPSLAALRDRWPAVANRLWQHPGCLYVAWEPDLGGKLIPRAAIVLNVGNQQLQARHDFQAVLPAWMISPDENALIPNALWHFRVSGSYFIWTLGTESCDQVEAALQAEPNRPELNPALLAAVKTWDASQPGHRLWINLPIDEWRQKAPALWDRTPLSAVAELVPLWQSLSVMGSDDSGLVCRTVWLGNDQRPLAPWFVPLAGNAADLIPADAHYAASVGLSLPHLAEAVAAIMSHLPMLPPDAPERLRERVEAELGLNLEHDVLPAFGSTFSVSSAPSTGGALGLSPVFSWDVRQPRQAHVAFIQAMQAVQRHIQRDVPQATFHDELFLDRAVYTMQFRSTGGITFAPTFCITDKQLLVTLQPQTMRSHLRFLEKPTATFAGRKDAVIPNEAMGFVFVDAPAFMQTLWPILPLVANARLNELHGNGSAIDGDVIPSTAAMMPHVRPAFGVIRRGENALVAEMRNPLSAVAPVLTAAALWGLSQDRGSTSPPALLESPAIDLGAPDGELSLDAPASALDAIPPVSAVTTIPTVEPPQPRRVWLSGLIRAVTPDDVEATLPQSIFDRIERGPSPEEVKRREERRQERAAKRNRLPR